MADTGQPKTVKAIYNFKPQNTDELAFSKGDHITITQVVEGGWWEGTLGDKTGWFPSNYAKEIKSDGRVGAKSPKPGDLPINKRESMVYYHNVVLQSLIDTERHLVSELQSLLQNCLRPLQSANIISGAEYKQLVGNSEDLAVLHQNLLSSLDDCAKQPISQQRIGGVFMKQAPHLKNLYKGYCANHPQAVEVLQKRKDELNKYMESIGAPPPGIMKLTTSISLPFTRLEKYPNLLKELERHTEESHPDRGDTQRAISIYKDIATSCVEIRKLKELEYELMNSTIKGWEGEDIHGLGEVLQMSHVKVHVDSGDKKERLFVLFPGLLVFLSVSPRMSGYLYEGKLPVSGMTINTLEDTETITNSFDISGNMIDKRIVSCTSKTEQTNWVEILRKQAKLSPTHTSTKPQSLQISSTQPSVHTLPPSQAKTARVLLQPLRRQQPGCSSTWTLSCLRPSPPLRSQLLLRDDINRSPKSGRKPHGTFRKKPADEHRTMEEDTLILKVIEAYCTSAKARHTVNSSLLDSPQVLIAEDEKIIIEELKGDETVIEEKSLVDTVYHLKDQVKELKQGQEELRRDMDDEKKARRKLESYLRRSLKSGVVESYTDSELPTPT